MYSYSHNLARIKVCLSTLLLGLVPISVAAAHQASNPSSLFAPGSHVPLSDFKDRLLGFGTTTMFVNIEILDWIDAMNYEVKVAVKSGGSVQYVNPSINWMTGAVSISGSLTGKCVVVCPNLKQDLNIVSHWDASLNPQPSPTPPKGGWSLGATDGINTLDYDPVKGAIGRAGNNSVQNQKPPYPDPAAWAHATAGDYHYASDEYALFADESNLHADAVVPAYERYVGETYSVNHVTKLAAIALSDQTREATGFPVAHRNHPFAFDPTAPLRKRVQSDLPLFQIAHCYVVDISDTYDLENLIPGTENSLGSFVLPPFWTAAVEPGAYPILFNGKYDIHDATFQGQGPVTLQALGNLYNRPEPRFAIGILWNGGGESATYTTQESAYYNCERLIKKAAELLKADKERVVFTGGSRGAMAALEMGSNPYDLDYTAKFIHAANGNTRLGDMIDATTPSQKLGMLAFAGVTGYRDAWMEDWEDPNGPIGFKSREDLVKKNLFDTYLTSEVNARCPDSQLYRSRLAAEGAGLVLRFGTHDYSRTTVHLADYVHNLTTLHPTVPVRLEVFYRAGHDRRVETPDDEGLLNMVFDQTALDSDVVFFASDPNDPDGHVEIDPTYVPLAFECPLMVGKNQDLTYGFFGEPGARVQIHMGLMPAGWFPGDPYTKPALTLFEDVVLGPGPLFGTYFVEKPLNVSPGNRFWWYEAWYSPDGDGSFEDILELGAIAAIKGQPSGEPVIYVTNTETVGHDFDTRTGGVAGDEEWVP